MNNSKFELATFACGWFWNPEASFGCVEGVVRTKVGYTGGTTINPTYHNIGDHTETIQLEYDPSKTTYQKLLDIFWSTHNPTFRCSSLQYKSGIWYHSKEQEELAKKSKQQKESNRRTTIFTVVEPASTFTVAEDYHQKWKLRKQTNILKALKLNDEQLISSTIAARINGYVGGCGTLESLMKEIDSFGLPQHLKNDLISIVKRWEHYKYQNNTTNEVVSIKYWRKYCPLKCCDFGNCVLQMMSSILKLSVERNNVF